MVDLLIEVVFSGLIELLGELLFEVGFRGVARVLRYWLTRTILLGVLGVAGGWAWGARLSGEGRVELPRTFWTSLIIAGASVLLLLWRLAQPRWRDSNEIVAPPWRWPAQRVAGYAVLSLLVAAGVLAGFSPA